MGKIWATIDRFEEDKAVLILFDQQQIIIDKKVLPEGVVEGDYLNIQLNLSPGETIKSKKKIKKLLNQINK